MPNRIKVLVNQSGFDGGIHYLIYGGDSAPVNDDKPLMEVDEQLVQKRMLNENNVTLIQRPDASSCFYVPHVFLNTPAPQVYIDGVPVVIENLTLYPNERMIRIHDEIPYPTEKVITMDYRYLVSVITDDYTRPQTGVVHHGKTVPTGIVAPASVTYDMDYVAKKLTITVTQDIVPTNKYYRIRYLDTKLGRVSQPTADQLISIQPNTFDLKLVLEVSKNGGKDWIFLQQQPLTVGKFVLSNFDDITGSPHMPLDFTLTPMSANSLEVRIKNPWYMWQENGRPTHIYRIKTVDVNGQESNFKVFQEGLVNYRPTKLRIRRKHENGTPSTYDEHDALTMWDVTAADIDVMEPELVFIDDHLIAGQKYSYTFFIDDEINKRTPPFWGKVTTPSS